MRGYQKVSFECFNLKATLESGQVFRYDRDGEFYILQHADFVIKARQQQNSIIFSGVHADGRQVTEQTVRHLFRLDKSHDDMIRGLRKDRHLNELAERYRGLHIMRQALFECIIAFMCSSAANIPKIKMNVSLLAEKFGKQFTFEGKEFHSFPLPGFIDNIQKIKSAKTGFRAKYIFKANKMLTKEFLEELQAADYAKAREMLLTIPGIGEKVANCILLFSLGHSKAFPVDTWMKKILLEKYGPQLRVSVKAKRITEERMTEFGVKRFGNSAGLAQQYLFVHARSRKRIP